MYPKIENREFEFWGTHSTPKNEIAHVPKIIKNQKTGFLANSGF